MRGSRSLRPHRIRPRFWLELAATVSAAFLAILTVALPTWVEIIFGFDPDEGRGWFEVGLTVAFAASAAVSSVLAGREWRQRLSPA
jgi:hypothetical protein